LSHRLARSRSPAVASFLPQQRRLVHHRVPPPFDVEEGLQPFLSPENLRTVAVDWQDGVLARLNELTRGPSLSPFPSSHHVVRFASLRYKLQIS
jgi:hypothetical protein